MTPDQIPELIKQISYADSRILPTDPAEAIGMAALWATVLTDVPYDYAVHAVGQHYANSPFTIRPADIASRWAADVRSRLARHTDPIPAVDPDDDATWRAQLLATRRAVAHGHIEPTPHAIAAGPPVAIAELTAGIGRTVPRKDKTCPYLPPALRADLAASIPGWAEREAARQAGDADLLSIVCTWCRAEVGQQCRRRKTGKDRAGWHRRAQPHPSRADAVVVAGGACPACSSEVGSPCCETDGSLLPGVHRERMTAVLGEGVVTDADPREAS